VPERCRQGYKSRSSGPWGRKGWEQPHLLDGGRLTALELGSVVYREGFQFLLERKGDSVRGRIVRARGLSGA